MMKLNTSDFIAAATLVILVGYISYDASRSPLRTAGAISDQSTMMVDLEDASHPLPAVSFDVPQGITFAGEPVPLDIPDVRERLDKELQINVYFHSNTIFLIKGANRLLPQMEKILKEDGIPEDFMYLPLIKSNLLNVFSPKLAVV